MYGNTLGVDNPTPRPTPCPRPYSKIVLIFPLQLLLSKYLNLTLIEQINVIFMFL